jgi:hypothetical protein
MPLKYRRSYRYSLPIYNLGARRGWVFSTTFRLHYLRERDQVPTVSHRIEILFYGRLRLKCDVTRAETRFRLPAKRTSPFKSAEGGESVQSTTGSRGVRISGSNARYTMFRGSGYPLHSPVSPSLPLPYSTVCHHISTGLYTPVFACRD